LGGSVVDVSVLDPNAPKIEQTAIKKTCLMLESPTNLVKFLNSETG